MAKFEIVGGAKLKGKIKVVGNKNAILPAMAAALLTSEKVILNNVPRIGDVLVFGELLKQIGCQLTGLGTSKLEIRVREVKSSVLAPNLVSKLRASILLSGPLLVRTGKFEMRHPGGDIIGRRGVDTHLEALANLGAAIEKDNEAYSGAVTKLRSGKIFLSETSVTATENTLMAAILIPGVTVIKNAASEPHVQDLSKMLVKMGAKITGIGSNLLEIQGVKNLKGVEFEVGPDYVEAGTLAIAAAVTGGEVEIEGVNFEDMEMILIYFDKMGVNFSQKNGNLIINPSKLTATAKVDSGLWPGFPTDLMSAMIVLATQANGVTLLHDWLYESRMFFVDKLISMGAAVTICDPHRVLVSGPTKLQGQELDTPDIRAGIALVIAALAADGKSLINRVELIDRGYQKIDERLAKLGAKIKRVY